MPAHVVGRAILLRNLVLWSIALLGDQVLAQMSPGPLSKAHHDLEGPLQCAKCHVFGARKTATPLPRLPPGDCPSPDGDARLSRLASRKEPGSNDCARCHSEHNGQHHRLVRWPVPKEKLDHAKAGWKLEGKHAQLKCTECHTAKYIDPQDRAVLKRHDLNTTFAGLETSCIACHRDVHAGQLSRRCTDCHSQDSWKNPPGFSHEKTRYPLTGLHANVECAKCHRPGPAAVSTAIQYKNFTFLITAPRVTGTLTAAASAAIARAAMLPVAGSRFFRPTDSITARPTIRCSANTRQWPARTAIRRKTSRLRSRSPGVSIAMRISTVDNSTAAPMGAIASLVTSRPVEARPFHGCGPCQTAYPLLGKHAEVTCVKCHLPRGKDTLYRVPFAKCTACHQDGHKGQFATARHNNRCEDCHNASAWKPALYTLASHNQTTFALKGAHVAVPMLRLQYRRSRHRDRLSSRRRPIAPNATRIRMDNWLSPRAAKAAIR